MWLYISLIHFIYNENMKQHIDAYYNDCQCAIQKIPETPEYIGEKARLYQEALNQMECLKKCPTKAFLKKKAKRMAAMAKVTASTAASAATSATTV